MFLLVAAAALVEGVVRLVAAVAGFLIRRPPVLATVAVLAFLWWLLAPILGAAAGNSALYVIGAVGMLTMTLTVGRAIRDDHRYERLLAARAAAEAAELAAAEAAAARPGVPAGERWWEEQR